MTRCFICDRGRLINGNVGVWQCERRTCNSEFYIEYDEEFKARLLQVRDKRRENSL